MRSKGSQAFTIAFPGDPVSVGDRFGVAERTVMSWRTGTRSPADDKRRAIHAAGGPAPSAWDEPADLGAGAVFGLTAAPVAGSATPEAVVTLADEELARVREFASALEREALPVRDRVMLHAKLSDMIIGLGKLTGASIVNERQVVMSPVFGNLMREAAQALAPWPEACRALAAWLQGRGRS